MMNNSSQVKLNSLPTFFKLAVLAALFWFLALALPAIVYFGDREPIYGYEVLLVGMFGPLALNFAWYANILWFIALLRLSDDNSLPIKPAGWAAVLSINAFTLSAIPSSTTASPVYGLGIGAILWLIAIAITFLAAGMKKKELTGEVESLKIGKFYVIGLITFIGFLSIHNRIVGNADERDKLNNSFVGFKRSPICSVSPRPANSIEIDGALELDHSRLHYLDDPKYFLDLGIPVVRKDGLDYFLDQLGEIQSRPALTRIAAVLRVSKEYPNDQNCCGDESPRWGPVFRVVLTDANGTVGFDQIIMEQYVRQYCPRIEPLLLETLNISKNNLR